MPQSTHSARHWQSLAREAREVAEKMTDAAAKLIMLNIARGYERLAAVAEARNKKPE